MGGVVPLTAVLVRTDVVVVAVVQARAYPVGFELDLTVRLRHPDQLDERAAVDDGRLWDVPGQNRPGGLRFGLGYADGRRATRLGWPHLFDAPPEAPPGPVLMPGGASHSGGVVVAEAGGTRARHDHSAWVWELPPPGPVTLAVEWAAQGLAETTVDVVDGAVLREAAGRALPLWPGGRTA